MVTYGVLFVLVVLPLRIDENKPQLAAAAVDDEALVLLLALVVFVDRCNRNPGYVL